MNILIAGDFCPQHRVANLFEKGDYASVLSDVKPFVVQTDYSIVNFECPVTKGDEKPILKQGPNLHCSEKGVEAAKWVGFDCVTLANNHFLDYGKEGVENTSEACKKYGLDVVGGGMNLTEASKTLYKELKGETLAIINCCEHEFSIATETTAGSNPLNLIQQFYAIKEARKKADYVLVIVHGGHELWQLPSPRMVETYRFFIDSGADAVVNHHQHCFSGYEVYNGKPIFYGLGNFCFDNPEKINDIWNEGYCVLLSFSSDISFELLPYIQCSSNSQISFFNEAAKQSFIHKIEKLNEIILNEEELRCVFRKFIDNHNTTIKALFEPYSNSVLLSLFKRNLLPSFVPKEKKIRLKAYLQCESHICKVLNYFNNI